MPSTFPDTPDDLARSDLTHGDVTDALTAVEAYLGEGGRLLSGAGAPASGDGMYPLDGVNDPWRWAAYPPIGGWVGPAFQVTAVEGAVLDLSAVSLPVFGQLNLILDGVNLSDKNNISQWAFDSPSADFGQPSKTVLVGGSCIAFIVQYEADFGGPTAVPVPDLNLADYLGAGFTLGAAYEFPTADTGTDGDYYRDTSAADGTLVLYGPKAGSWPAPLTVVGENTADPTVLYSPSGTAYRLTVADDGTLTTEPA